MPSEELNSIERPFRARLNNGSEILYKAKWVGYADFDTRQEGGPSTWDHPFDDRRCHWTANGRIIRSVAVVVAGKEYWADELTTALSQSESNQGSSFVIADLRPENCNDCRTRRESDFSDMRERVNGSLQAIADADFTNVINAIKGLPDIIEVNLS